MNSLSEKLNSFQVGCCVGNKILNHVFYADDIPVCLLSLSPSLNGLQDLAYLAANSYAQKHNIIFNCTKSTGILFKPKQFCFSSPKLFPGDDIVNFFDTVTYLGVKLNSLLTDEHDIYRQVHSIDYSANKLKAKFSKCSPSVKNVHFRSYCMQFYSSQLWNKCSKSRYHRIKVAYNDAFRILHIAPQYISTRELQVQNNVVTFDANVRKSAFTF